MTFNFFNISDITEGESSLANNMADNVSSQNEGELITVPVCRLLLKFRAPSGTTQEEARQIGTTAAGKVFESFDDSDKGSLAMRLEYVLPKPNGELTVILAISTTCQSKKDEMKKHLKREYCDDSSEPLTVELGGQIVKTEKNIVFSGIEGSPVSGEQSEPGDPSGRTSTLFQVVIDGDFDEFDKKQDLSSLQPLLDDLKQYVAAKTNGECDVKVKGFFPGPEVYK